MSIAPLDVADATAETLLGATAAAATDDEDATIPVVAMTNAVRIDIRRDIPSPLFS